MSRGLTPIIVEYPQRSEEWFKARLGNLTSSDVKHIFSYATRSVTKAKLKDADTHYAESEDTLGEDVLQRLREEYPTEYCLQAGIDVTENDTRRNLRRRIVAERIYKIRVEADQYVNEAMKWGVSAEIVARQEYVRLTGNLAEESPMVLHPKLMTGSSRDSTIVDKTTGEIGNGEIKCLTPARHIYDVILANKMPAEFVPQVQHQMWLYDTDWCDFTGWDGRLPLEAGSIVTLIVRIDRDDFYIDYVLEPAVRRFLQECDKDERRFWAIIKGRKNEKSTVQQ